MIIGIDPGVNRTAIAYAPKGCHIKTDYVTIEALRALFRMPLFIGAQAHLEIPIVRPSSCSPGGPEDLMRLRSVCGQIIEMAHWCKMQEPITYVPSAWKGTIKGDMHNARVLTSAAKLPYASGAIYRIGEMPITYRHNVIDALGIYLFANKVIGKNGDLTC